jgi:hypothetical protein
MVERERKMEEESLKRGHSAALSEGHGPGADIDNFKNRKKKET